MEFHARRGALTGCLAALCAVAAGADLQPRPLPGTRAEAATLIVQGIEGGSLTFAALALGHAAQAVPDADGSPRVRLPIAFEVPGQASNATSLEFYAYAMTRSGAVVAHLGLALELEPGRLAAGAGAKLFASLDLPPASYSLRFLVLEPASHRFGLRRIELTLPGSGEPATLTRPTFDDPCAGWLVASTPQASPSTASALPVLLTGSRVELSSSVPGRAAEGAADSRAATVFLEPTRAEGSESHAFPAELAAGEGDALDLGFDLPPIARGVYRLALELERGASRLISPATEVWVVDSDDLDTTSKDPCARTWSAIIARSAGRIGSLRGAPPAGDEVAGVAGPGKRAGLAELRRAYLEVLRQLAATGDLDSAAAALCDLEGEHANVRSALQALLRNELVVAKRLAAREPEIVPPLMLLHHEAYLAHVRRERYPLAGHSTRVVQALTELMADRRQREESQALAAGILTSLAEYGHRKRMFVPGRLLLEDALEMDPGNQDALLLLAVNYEWFGRYDEAGKLLERLARLAATHSEARLRLAIVRLRTGNAGEAERDLRLILREGAPAWLLSLAYQALAELMNGQERYDDAVALLREGRSRLGSDQRLHLLSAHALDRVGRPAEARRLLERLPIDGSMRTPRFRYGESLTSPLTALRESVSRSVAVRLPLLERALEREPAR